MPQFKIALKPGIDAQATPTLNSAGWSSSNGIRWKDGYVEKMGGWVSSCTIRTTGSARALHGFSDLENSNYIAIGTNSRLQLLTNGALTDITPLRKTSNLSNALSTTSGSNAVNIADAAHGALAGDWIELPIPTAIGGLLLMGFYLVASIVDANNYTVNAASNATGTVAGGGAVPAFTTINTSNSISVVLNNHGLSIGSLFNVQVSTAVGGLTLLGGYLVATVPDANHFTFLSALSATSAATVSENSGKVEVEYLISSGAASSSHVAGWGSGSYGGGSWGTSSAATVFSRLRTWSLDNFGQNLVAVPSGGTLYAWVPATFPNPALAVSGAPLYATAGFVAMPQQQVVLLGAETGGTQDDLLVRWCDVGDYTIWTATASNQAGSFRLSNASRIVGGTQSPQAALIWTDRDLWAMTYVQLPYVYSFTVIGKECGVIAQKAYAGIGRNTYWLSAHGFFAFGDGGVQQLSCPVWDIVFNNLNLANSDKCFAASNAEFGEVLFFYPSASGQTGEIDSYVKFNVREGLWDYGSLTRLAWVDGNPLGAPISVDAQGNLLQQETGYDAAGSPFTGTFVQSGYADLADGTQYVFVDQIIPDIYMTGNDPSVTVTVYGQNYPGGAVTAFGPYTVTPSTQYITLRTRARQLAFRVQCDTLGTFWRVGAIRYRGAPSGRR